MSDYDRDTGILSLSLQELHDFHRTADRKPGTKPGIEFYADKLMSFGHEVTQVSADGLQVKAPADEIFELLSGQHIYL